MESDPVQLVQDLKKHGRRVIACFPLYPPVELFHSLGLTPVVLWGRPLSGLAIDASYRHLQTFACSVAHRAAEFLLTDAGKLVDGVFGYNACDTLRNLPEIVALGPGSSGPPWFGFHLPQAPRSQTDSTAYLKNEIGSLISDLEEAYRVEFSEAAFQQSVELYRRTRELIQQKERRLPFARFAEAVETSHFLPVEEQIARFERLGEEEPSGGGGRIVVSGIQAPPSPVIDLLEASGLRVVANDVASLARSFHYTPESFDSVFDYYQDCYDNHHPCTTLLYTADDRIPHLARLIDESQAEGFVLVGEKFCEHEYFEIPGLERMLRERGLQVLTLEFSLDDEGTSEAVRTRIEAFAEIVNG